jgi:16S rRNA (guanine(966)-N(2))-methyltransferase RsmD
VPPDEAAAVGDGVGAGFLRKKLNMRRVLRIRVFYEPLPLRCFIGVACIRGRAVNRPVGAVQGPRARPGEVRLIAGQWKRSKLPVLDKPGLRPTPDRVRETLFNWLGHDLAGWRCLDVFAGTGALGFEAASRGAASVQMVELDRDLVAQLGRMQQQLGASAVRIVPGDALAALSKLPSASMDLVFLDPPFSENLLPPALQAVGRLLAKGGLVYLEAPLEWKDEQLAGFSLLRRRHFRAGAVHAHLLARIEVAPAV